ncbi:MAG: ATP-binding protein [Candidatus Brocadiaceae bacterium]|nr:ATP-binding protein [Candidatus Brocadiaceae bacterium]
MPIGKRSFFLFGPRQVGKSTLIKSLLSKSDILLIDLLLYQTLIKYKSNPEILIDEVAFLIKGKKNRSRVTVFIDEIQKAPELLDSVHYLIEKFKNKVTFILTGSSARKLKKTSANMLAGRAWHYNLFPLTHLELGEDFVLGAALLKGTLPPLVSESRKACFSILKSYTQTYLKEEILDEAMVRNIGAFSNFLHIAADQSGKIVNYSTMARETGVSSKTIKGYYEILEDTLIAVKLEPYLKSARKRLVRHPKYYLFDLGVINSLNGRITEESVKPPTIYGTLFEHFIILEVYRLIHYIEKPYRLYHWRSSHGAEVDLVVESHNRVWAIEIKSSKVVQSKDLRGLASFMDEHPGAIPLCVSINDLAYQRGKIPVIPWKLLFEKEFLRLSPCR